MKVQKKWVKNEGRILFSVETWLHGHFPQANKSPAFLPPSPTFARQVEIEDFYDEWPVDVEKPRDPMMPSIRKRWCLEMVTQNNE